MNKITIQDGKAAQVVVYVNWGDEEILSEAEYKIKLEEETTLFAADSYQFDLWLDGGCTAADIWNMTEEEKEEIKAQWLKYCRKCAEEELCYERRVLI